MGPITQAVSAVLMVVAIVSSNVALCAGWQSRADARMACCHDSDPCPMDVSHMAGSRGNQAAADRCCAAAEPHKTTELHPGVVVHLGLNAFAHPAAGIPDSVSALLIPRPAADPPSEVPLHLRLSVLLV